MSYCKVSVSNISVLPMLILDILISYALENLQFL